MPQVQRRRERNQREQKRSNEISSQIDGLRRVLTDAGVAVKASKSAILVGTAQYAPPAHAKSAPSSRARGQARRRFPETPTSARRAAGRGTGDVRAAPAGARA